MKVLFINFEVPFLIKDSQYPVGGYAVQLLTWLKTLPKKGHEPAVLSFKGANNYIDKKNDFEILDTYDPDKGITILKYFYLYIPSLLTTSRKFKPDVIIQGCSGLDTGIMGFIASRLKVPYIYRVANDTDVDDRCKSRLAWYAYYTFQYGLKKSDAVICQNSYQYDCLKRTFPDKPLFIIHNPFDMTRVSKEILPRKERDYIAWVGVFSKKKNMPLLYSTAKRNPDVKFKIAGSAFSLDKDTGSVINKLEQLSNVEFVGYLKRDETLCFLRKAIALLSTSNYEGFSNVFLESFASGTPVIAPLRIDPDHIITKNKLGYTTENEANLPALIVDMCSLDHDEFELLTHKCQKYLIENFNPTHKVDQLDSALSQVINKPI